MNAFSPIKVSTGFALQTGKRDFNWCFREPRDLRIVSYLLDFHINMDFLLVALINRSQTVHKPFMWNNQVSLYEIRQLFSD